MGTPSPNMERFLAELLRRAPGTRSGGIAPGDPNQGGYHNTRRKLVALGKSGDYSLRHPWDKRGNDDRYRAVDWVFPDAQGGNYATIRRYMTRIREAFDRRDGLLTGWREALGQQDSDGDPEGFDFVGWYTRTPDMTHMWHIHLSLMNEFVDEWWPYENMLTILFGQPEGEDVDSEQNRKLDNADKYLWKLHELEPKVPINGNSELDSKLVRALVKLFADIEEIRVELSQLAGGVTAEQFEATHERVMRKILGEADGATPAPGGGS